MGWIETERKKGFGVKRKSLVENERMGFRNNNGGGWRR